MLCGSAFKNKGVQAMLDAVIDYLPSPVDVPAIKGHDERDREIERHPTDKEPFSALAFKIMTDPFVGQLVFFRAYSGVVKSGDSVYIPGKERRSGWAASCRRTPTSGARSPKSMPATSRRRWGEGRHHRRYAQRPGARHYPGTHGVQPVISQAVEPKTKADQEKMGIALGRLAQEDPSFRVRTDEESGQTIISGMGRRAGGATRWWT